MRISDWSSDVCSSDLHPFAEIAEVGRREQLVHRQPGLHIFLRLMLEDVLAAVRAEVELLTLVNGLPIAMPRGIARLGEHGRQMACLAQLGETIIGVWRAGSRHFLYVLPARPVISVEH